jgi:hypothetical protein
VLVDVSSVEVVVDSGVGVEACAVVVGSAPIEPSKATTPHASAKAATVPAITRRRMRRMRAARAARSSWAMCTSFDPAAERAL